MNNREMVIYEISPNWENSLVTGVPQEHGSYIKISPNGENIVTTVKGETGIVLGWNNN